MFRTDNQTVLREENIAFCTATETVQKALPLFKKLAAEYGLN